MLVGPIVPYGLPAIRELFRFLISIMNPYDKQNNDEMSHMGIYLLTIALETAVDHLPKYASLMALVKDELCFNLLRVCGICIGTGTCQLIFLVIRYTWSFINIFFSLRSETNFSRFLLPVSSLAMSVYVLCK